jgi:hypothetical protein
MMTEPDPTRPARRGPIVGWLLDRDQRLLLLEHFPPIWPDVIADHVTLTRGRDLPPPVSAAIIGEVDDGEGLQALVVAVEGTAARPDGSIYHITWSLDAARGRKPVESNAVLARIGWQPLDPPVPILLAPGRW